MTPLQLKVAIATAQFSSISGAAKAMNISQPNASNSVKALEEEIGFRIFNRSALGTVLTEKGAMFMEHARKIISENERIMAIRSYGEIYRLRLGGVNYSGAIEPFLKICAQHRDEEETDLRYVDVSVIEGVQALAKRELDIVITPVLKYQLTGLANACKQKYIDMMHIYQIPAVIIVRKDHPAALDGRIKHITQGCDLMKEFPYSAYRNLYEDNGSTGYSDADYIQCAYKIYADERDVRLSIVGATNAFAFGARTTKAMMDRYGLIDYPVKDVNLDVYALTRPFDAGKQEIDEYLNLLREELTSIANADEIS